MNTLNLQPLRQQIYNYLRQEMQTGALLPGSNIDVNKISRELGVSKTPLRDALIRLEARGFVKIIPRRGVRVNVLTLRNIRNLYEILGALESSVIVTVFDEFDQGRLDRMACINEEYRDAISAGDSEGIYRSNLSFHGSFLDLSENGDLQELIDPLKQRLYDFPRRAYISEWELRNAQEHQQLIAFITKGDREGAAHIMRNVHWSYSYHEEFIRQFYALGIEEYRIEIANIESGERQRKTGLPPVMSVP